MESGRSAHVSGQQGGAETVVELPEAVVLANTLIDPHLVADYGRGCRREEDLLILDERAGDFGGHSFLLAALCRRAGIPARVVRGCMYVPHGGGAAGQHPWNEVHMGGAGRVSGSSPPGASAVDSGRALGALR